MTPERRAALFTRVDRATEVPMLLLALAFLVAIALTELADLPENVNLVLEGVSWFVWLAFACELIVKTYLAPARGRYLATHWIDVATVALPFLRPLRLLRVLLAGARLWTEARTVLRHRALSLVTIGGALALGLAASAVYVAERGAGGPIQTFEDALWWAAATITTVGYGDVYPKSAVGRAIAVALMLVGISLFGLLTARVAAFFVEADERDSAVEQKLDTILQRLDRVEAQLERMERETGARGRS